MDEIHHKSGVLTVKSDDILHGKTYSSIVHTYQIVGSDINRKTQTSNLVQKVLEAQSQPIQSNAQELKMEDEP
jgi:hypothetical protein